MLSLFVGITALAFAPQPREAALARFDPSATITEHSLKTVEDFDR